MSESVKISGVPESTIRLKIDEGIITKHKGKGYKFYDKREILTKLTPTVLTVFNQKGGCGKTSLSVLLGDYYDKIDNKILLVDFDQQCSLSKTYFSYEDLKESKTLYNFLEHRTPLNKIVKKFNENIDILPSDIKISRKDTSDVIELMSKSDEFNNLFRKYQVVVIDCPPAIYSFSKFAIMLANYILIPFIPEPYNYDGVIEAINSINLLKKFATSLIDYKIIVSAHEQRKTSVHENYIELIREDVNEKVTKNSIPNFVGIKERGFRVENIFDTFQDKEKSIIKIKKVLDEIDTFIYDERGN